MLQNVSPVQNKHRHFKIGEMARFLRQEKLT